MELSDQEIVQGIQKGEDDKILALLYKQVLPNVVRFICKNSGNEDEAHDIFQDAVIIFYKQVKNDTFNEKYKVAGFLYSVSRNLWINRAKRKRRQVELPEGQDFIDVDNSVLSNIITEERVSIIKELLDKLGGNCKEILMYSVYEKLSMKEICEKMGYSSENTAKTRNYKCKQRLIKLVKESQFLSEELKL